MKNTINLFKFFWLPVALLIGWVLFLNKLNIIEVQAQQIVLGIVLGTSLGFISEILKKVGTIFKKRIRLEKLLRLY